VNGSTNVQLAPPSVEWLAKKFPVANTWFRKLAAVGSLSFEV